MNVLLAFPFEDGETGIAIKEAFERTGHNVICVDAIRQYEELFFFTKQNASDLDLILCSRSAMLYDELIKIRSAFKDIKLAVWNTDVRANINDWSRLKYMFRFVDFYFGVADGKEQEYKNEGINFHHLPQGLDDRRYFPMKPTEWHKMEYACDLGFIGNIVQGIHQKRFDTINEVSNSGVNLKQFTNIFQDNHNYAVAVSRLMLGDSAYPEIKGCYSVRNWKVLGAGGIMIDRRHEGIDEFFNGYVHAYDEVSDLLTLIKNLLENYDENKKKAEEAAKWVKAEHCYTHRIKKMLKIVFG